MILDIVVLVVMFVSAVIAFLRGFIREMLTIMGVVGGVIAALALGGKFAPVVLGWIQPEAPQDGAEAERIFGVLSPALAADILAYGIIFIVVVIILSVVSHFLAGWARSLGLGAVDRSLGVVFGLVRGAALLSLLYLLPYMLFDREQRWEWFADSKTHHYVESGAAWIEAQIPQSAVSEAQRKGEEIAKRKVEAAAGDARARLLGVEELRPDAEIPAGTAGAEGTGYERGERLDLNELIRENNEQRDE